MRVTLTADTLARLRRAQALLGHSVLDGSPAVIIDKALSLLVDQLERTRRRGHNGYECEQAFGKQMRGPGGVTT